MTKRSFNYYGYTKDSYIECSKMIRATNRNHILILNSWFFAVNIFYMIFSYFNLFGATQEQIPFYLAFILISAAFGLWIFLKPEKVEKHNYFAVIFSIGMLLTYGILSSASQPYMQASMFPIMLIITAISYTGRMYLMMLMTIVASGVFLYTSYKFKTFSIAYRDSYNVAIVATLAIILYYTFQRIRIAQYILFQKDQQTRRELEIKSSFDALTMLMNRGCFFSVMEEMVRIARGERMFLCLLDLDGFKGINDTLGHQMGDKVIQTVGKVILKTLELEGKNQCVSEWDMKSPTSLAGRLGGDEFIILMRGANSMKESEGKMRNLMESLSEVKFDGIDGIRTSVGITEIKEGESDLDTAYKRADEALYESKRGGKNKISIG